MCRNMSYLIIKVLENKGLGMKFKSKLIELRILISTIAFVDDTDLVAEGNDVEQMIVDILQTQNNLHTATGGLIEQDKSKYFVSK